MNPFKDFALYLRGKRKTATGRLVNRAQDGADHTTDAVRGVGQSLLSAAGAARKRLFGVGRRAFKSFRDFVLFLRGKKKTTYGRWLGQRKKTVTEAWKDSLALVRQGVTRAFKSLRRALSVERQRIKLERRWTKYREGRALMREERRVLRQVDRLQPERRPLIVGPWISEVGYEALYWLPFLNYVTRHYNDRDREKVFVVSRGGAGSWYRNIGAKHLDIFDLMSPDDFAARSAQRRETSGTNKQQELSRLDREILDAARHHFDIPDARVCHPQLMYRLFNPCWYAWRPMRVLIDNTRFSAIDLPGPPPEWGLPEEYVAVKFYTAAATPDTPENRELFSGIVAALAQRTPVVLLDTGLVVDDHEDFLFADSGRIHGVRELMQPRNNLDVQARVIAGARAFYGTCGGLAWLAPMLGVDTVPLFEDAGFLNSHLWVAERAYREIGRGAFQPLHIGGLRRIGLTGEHLVGAIHTGNERP